MFINPLNDPSLGGASSGNFVWGDGTGIITNQTDLVNYIASQLSETNMGLWAYQDFAAGSITTTTVTLTTNSNGSGASFITNNLSSFTGIYDQAGDGYVYSSGFLGMFSGIISATARSGATVTLNKVPDSSEAVRIWWPYIGPMPASGYIAPPIAILNSSAAMNLLSELSGVNPINYDPSSGIISLKALTSGSSILSGDGAGRFSNVTIGSNLTFSGGTLSASSGGGGTVTSVAISVPGFLKVNGSPITTSGTMSIDYQAPLPVLNGGTGADLSSSGGAGYVVQQSSPGGPLFSAALDLSELAQYSYGNWTPVFNSWTFTGSGPTVIAKYVRIANMVTVWGNINGTTGTSTAGVSNITGLPFTGLDGCIVNWTVYKAGQPSSIMVSNALYSPDLNSSYLCFSCTYFTTDS